MKKKFLTCSLILLLSVFILPFAGSTSSLMTITGEKTETISGEMVEYTVSISNNTGLAGFMVYVYCDTAVFELKNDQATLGNFTSSGSIFTNADGTNGWKVLWFNAQNVTSNGSLFTLELSVASDAKAGTYPVSVYYSPSNTISGEYFEEANLSNALISLESDSSVLMGDVNCDGQITTSDVILTARYIVGLVNISEQQQILADVNGDANITNADVILLARYLLGLATLG